MPLAVGVLRLVVALDAGAGEVVEARELLLFGCSLHVLRCLALTTADRTDDFSQIFA